MTTLTQTNEFLDHVAKSGLVVAETLSEFATSDVLGPIDAARRLVSAGVLTQFQAELILQGTYRGFFVGRYKLLDLLGAGGMGRVYLCEHTGMGHRVAMKVLPTGAVENPAAVTRFLREARAAARLNHPNIVRAFDLDKSGDHHFLIMEYIEGLTLEAVVKQFGPLDANRAANYISQAATGLQHIAVSGLTHRDIKPANLIVDVSGTVKILDMGLAYIHNETGHGLTREAGPNAILGTADYIPPEQAVAASDADIRSDLYSLGGSLYYLLTGHAPFPGLTLTQKIICHQMKMPSPIANERPDLPAGLIAVAEKLLAKAPEDRYATPADVVAALQPWAEPWPEPLPVGKTTPTKTDTGTVPYFSPRPAPFPCTRPLTIESTPIPASRKETVGWIDVQNSSRRMRLSNSQILTEAVTAVRDGRRDVARNLLAEVTAADPQNEAAWLWLASVSDAPRTAVACLERVLTLNPTNELALSGLAAANVNLARQMAQEGDRDGARALLRDLVRSDPSNAAAWARLSKLVDDSVFAAHCARQASRLDPARFSGGSRAGTTCPACTTTAVAVDCPRCGLALNFRPPAEYVTRSLKDSKLATAAVDRLAAIQNPVPDVYRQRGLLLLNLARFQEALTELGSALANRPDPELAKYVETVRNYTAAAAARVVLVVDDSPTVRKHVVMILTKAGYQVRDATDAEKALENVQQYGAPGLFLIDIMMPGMDGYQLCKTLKQNVLTASVPVVMLSGKDGFFNKVRGRMAGASQYLTKPFQPPQLLAAIAQHLGSAAGG